MPERAVSGLVPAQVRDVESTVPYAIGIAFAALVVLAGTHNVNWDEFYFLSQVHAYLDGRLNRPMQTAFVHGFGWLARVPGDEMNQILAARLVMVVCLGATALALHRIASHLTDRQCATLAVLGFLASGYVLPYGASFRADPIAAAFLMGAVAIVLTTRLTALQIGLAAAFCAFAALVTIKAVLYLPVFLGVLIWRMQSPAIALRIVATGFLAALIWIALYTWHASGITPAPGNDTSANARDALLTTLIKSGLFPRAGETLTWALFSVAQIGLAVLGVARTRDRRLALLLVLFAAPLLAVVVYRNAFPYYFPFAAPLMMVAMAVGARHLGQVAMRGRIVIFMLAAAVAQAGFSLTEGTAVQRATIAEVHRLFPEPVPYISEGGMIASFPDVGFFMTGWGVARYRAAGQPVLAKAIAASQPPLLVASSQAMVSALRQSPEQAASPILLPQDHAVVYQTYVHHAGAIWLAGREVTLGDKPLTVMLPFPGRYRVVADAALTIDGDAAAIVDFDGTPIELHGPAGAGVKLVWDTGVEPDGKALPAEGLFAPFWSLL